MKMKKQSPIRMLFSFIVIVLLVAFFGPNKNNANKHETSTASKNITQVVSNLLPQENTPKDKEGIIGEDIQEAGNYTSKDEVALYIHKYNKLPNNFITKKEAQALGWDNTINNVGDITKGKSIGGDRFGNFEGKLPKEKGRQYFEADIDYAGKKRNAKRIVFSNDGFIYYTDDHYESFTLLYTKEGKQ